MNRNCLYIKYGQNRTYFYKSIQSQTYLCKHKNCMSTRGSKAMNEKDQVTGHVCAIKTGVRGPTCIIQNARDPGCVRPESCSVFYSSQVWALLDTSTFKRWYYDVFQPFVLYFVSISMISLMDSCDPNVAKLSDSRGRVKSMTPLPNWTFLRKPMSIEIISLWMLKKRSWLVRAVVNDLESLRQRRDDRTGLEQSVRGLSEDRDPNLLATGNMVAKGV